MLGCRHLYSYCFVGDIQGRGKAVKIKLIPGNRLDENDALVKQVHLVNHSKIACCCYGLLCLVRVTKL